MANAGQGRQWTREQLAAIQARRSNLLVAAAAGAGKTAVLVERIIRRLTDLEDPLSLENLLVVTFTEAAAAEMRQRIGVALEEAVARQPENEYLRRQLMLLNHAHISTIHSFCLWVLRTYFYRIELDPGFRVMDPAEVDLLKLEVMEQVLEECFAAEAGEGPVTNLADSLGGQGDTNLVNQVLKVWDFCCSLPWPQTWLEKALAAYQFQPGSKLEDLPWYPLLLEAIAMKLQEAIFYLHQAHQLAASPGGPAVYLDSLEEEIDRAENILADLANLTWKELNQRLTAFSFGRLKPVRGDRVDGNLKEKAIALRNQAKKVIKRLVEEFCRAEETVRSELVRAWESAAALAKLVHHYAKAFDEAKRRRNLVDFSDLEHLCLQVLLDTEAGPGELRPSAVARELRQRFAEILVDEYQDINSIQDAILTLIAREESPNLFMVGDVKQSIYRFRMANPELFLDKYHRYSETAGAKCRRILLAANFRSRPGVVNGVNFIFSQIFSRLVGELEYDADAALVARADYPHHEQAVDEAVEFYLLEKQLPEGEEADNEIETDEAGEEAGEAMATPQESLAELTVLEREALLVAGKIKELVEGTAARPGPLYQIWDNESKEYRDIAYRDIVILLRATSDRAPVFLEALKQHDIPAYADLSSGYFNAIEVETMLSLLRIIDNPRQDIPLAAVLRSPLVGLSAEELSAIRLVAPGKDFFTAVKAAAGQGGDGRPEARVEERLAGKLQEFLAKLDRWRTIARRNPLGDVIWQLYRETGYLEFVGGLPGGSQRQANLRVLLDRARQFESFTRHGLFRFLNFIDRLQQQGELGAARALGENENVVRIMSIHKAKGLEFPVVIIADLGKEFNLQDLSADNLLHGKLGLGPLYMDTNAGIKYPTLPYLAISHRLRLEALSEEVRVLYVALTRAREKLILVGSAADLPRQAERWCAGLPASDQQLAPVLLARGRSMLDWLCLALARHPQGAAIRELAGVETGHLLDDTSCWQVRVVKTPSSLFEQTREIRGEAEAGTLLPEPLPSEEAFYRDKPLATEIIRIRAENSDIAGTARDRHYWRQEVSRRLSWVYPRQQLASLPVKLTVTDLKRRFDVFNENDTPVAPGYSGISRRPLFMQEQQGLTAAERGTITHLVLQHLDLKQAVDRNNLEQLLQQMVQREILTAAQAEAVDVDAIVMFFNSPLGQRLLARPEKVQRELPFSLAIPARELYSSLPGEIGDEELILVQGIIDCLLEEEEGFLLLDFKTGRLPADPLAAYQEQLLYYSRAVATIFNRPVKEAYLYFLDSGQDIRVI
ncbi:MAG: helicase-exonuclease AddAB subunit AddA [Clostridia bacterium]|nr:helicase-exonuclease AddAB subunit AddA [Clostridia bacterium]